MDPLFTVHNSVYSPAAFELEQERLLRRVWTFVCHSSELAQVGSYVTRQVAGDPVVAVRASTDVIRAFHNVCRHRGSLVVPEPSGLTKAFQCCYHHWLYSLDGKLVAADAAAGRPGSDGEPAARAGVAQRADERDCPRPRSDRGRSWRRQPAATILASLARYDGHGAQCDSRRLKG